MILNVVIIISLSIFIWVLLPTAWGAPYIPSSFRAIKRALQLLDLKPNHTIVDLGAGDGRVVILAAQLYNSQCIGVEIDPIRCNIANMLISLIGLENNAYISRDNLYNFDLSNVDIVTMYLLPDTIQHLKEKLKFQLRAGARVVTFKFYVPDWIPTFVDEEMSIWVYEIDKNRR